MQRLADRALRGLPDVPGLGGAVQLEPGVWQVEIAGDDVRVEVVGGDTGAGRSVTTPVDGPQDTLRITVSDTTTAAGIGPAVVHALGAAAAERAGAADTDVLGPGTTPGDDALSARDAGHLAELALLADRATSDSPSARRGVEADAAALLDRLGLREGRNDGAAGRVEGGSPGFLARYAALPPAAQADVRLLNELPGLDAVPDGLPGRRATVVTALLSGGLPALLAQVPGFALGLLAGDVGRWVPALTNAVAGLVGSAAGGVVEAGHARLGGRRAARGDAESGVPADVQGAVDALAALALADGAAQRAALDGLEAQIAAAEVAAHATGPERSPRSMAARVADSGSRPGTATSSGARQPAGRTDAGLPAVPADRVAPLGATLVRYATGPLVAVGVGLVGIGVAAALGVAVAPVAFAGLAVSAATAGVVTVAQQRMATHKAELELTRKAVLDARARVQSHADVERALREDVRRRDAARDGLPEPGVPPRSTGPDVLSPGPTDGVLAPADLTAADAAVLVELWRLADAVSDAPRDGAVRARFAAAVAAVGLAVPDLGHDGRVDPDPDAEGWARRRAVLDPELRAAVAALDPTPSAVPSTAAHLAVAGVGTVLPGIAGGVVAGLAVGFGPLAVLTVAVAPVAAAVAQALGQRGGALSVEARKAAAVSTDPSAAVAALVETGRSQLLAETADHRDRQRAEDTREAARERNEAGRVARSERRRQLESGSRVSRVLGEVSEAAFGPGDPAPAPVPTAVPEPGSTDASTTDAMTTDAGAEPAVVAPAADPDRRAVVPGLLHTAVSSVVGPAVTAVAAVVAWSTVLGLRVEQLLSPAAWAALVADGQPLAGPLAVGMALAGGLGGVVAAGAQGVQARTAAQAAQRRKDALAVREARLAPAALAAARPATRARDDAAAEVRAARTRLEALEDAADGRAEDAVPRRRPGLVPATVARLTAWLAGLGDAEVTRAVADADPRSPLALTALGRTADGLPSTTGDQRAAVLAEVAAGAERAGLTGSDRSSGLSPALTAVTGALAALGGTYTMLATDDAFWQLVRTTANATGWWPEEECGCPPGGPCTCTGMPEQSTRDTDDPTRSRVPDAGDPSSAPPSSAPPSSALPSSPPVVVPPRPSGAGGRPTPSPLRPRPAPPLPPLPYGTTPAAGPGPGPAAGALPLRAPAGHPGGPPVDVEAWPDGTGSTSTVLVDVAAPGGDRVSLLARWVESGPDRRPVLVLSDVPGPGFWWGVPAAVLAAVTTALAALAVDDADRARAAVLGERADGTLTEVPVVPGPGAPQVVAGRGPRQLPDAEARGARTVLRLRPVPDLLGRRGASRPG